MNSPGRCGTCWRVWWHSRWSIFCCNKVTSKSILVLSVVMLLLGCDIEVALYWEGAPAPISLLADLYGAVFVTACNGLFEGFFYVAVGMLIGFRWGEPPKRRRSREAAGLALGLAGCVLITPTRIWRSVRCSQSRCSCSVSDAWATGLTRGHARRAPWSTWCT